MVPPHTRGSVPAKKASELTVRALSRLRGPWSQLGGPLKPAGKALEPAERALEPAGRPFVASWEARSYLGRPVERPGGGGGTEGTERQRIRTWYVVVP